MNRFFDHPTRRWVLALGYVAFIYATLPVVGPPVQFLRSHGVLRLTLGILYSACFVALWWELIQRNAKQVWRFVALIAVFALYLLISTQVSTPEERIHFLEYGLVGVFFSRALEPKLNGLARVLPVRQRRPDNFERPHPGRSARPAHSGYPRRR